MTESVSPPFGNGTLSPPVGNGTLIVSRSRHALSGKVTVQKRREASREYGLNALWHVASYTTCSEDLRSSTSPFDCRRAKAAKAYQTCWDGSKLFVSDCLGIGKDMNLAPLALVSRFAGKWGVMSTARFWSVQVNVPVLHVMPLSALPNAVGVRIVSTVALVKTFMRPYENGPPPLDNPSKGSLQRGFL